MSTAFFSTPGRWRRPLLAAALALLVVAEVGCAAPVRLPVGWPERLAELLPADVILLGEQHDAPEHHAMETTAVRWLAEQGRLGALVIEMAPAGGKTAGWMSSASPAEVRTALQWEERLWPWQNYAEMVMTAVRAGVPVLGGNLPRDEMRAAMANTSLDRALPDAGYAAQLDAVRVGHCDLLPPAQLPGMVRIQIARDQSMARVAAAAAAAADQAQGGTVLMVAGTGHVLRGRGIPVHLPVHLMSKVVLAHAGQAPAAINSEADLTFATPALPPRDVCAPLRLMPAASSSNPS